MYFHKTLEICNGFVTTTAKLVGLISMPRNGGFGKLKVEWGRIEGCVSCTVFAKSTYCRNITTASATPNNVIKFSFCYL
jgi:hypothetical protein